MSDYVFAAGRVAACNVNGKADLQVKVPLTVVKRNLSK